MNKQVRGGQLPEGRRQEFAGLDGDWAWLDNAGGSFALRRVIDRISEYLQATPVQLGGDYSRSRMAGERQAEAVRQLAAFVNAQDTEEIVLGSSSTALTWQIARALRPLLAKGDEIIITAMDHESNRSPWLWLRETGVNIRTWEIDRKDFALSLNRLDELLNERTRLVCFSQCSNILGHIEPVPEITRRAHAAGARVFVDGVAYAPHRRTDVRAWDVDFWTCSLYKIFGPHAGMLYGKREALLELGNINHEYLSPDALPYKLQPGGVSYELAWGAAGIAEYFSRWQAESGNDPFDLIARHETALAAPLLEFLEKHSRVMLVGPADCNPATRLPIISFRHATRPSRDIAKALVDRRLAVRNGHFHSRRLLEFLDIPPDDGVVRISFAHYNTMGEVERLVDALRDIVGKE